jgi:Protein of unknown function (DUF2637)
MTASPSLATPGVAVAAAVAADQWLTRFRAALVGVLGAAVAGIGALAFYTSFEAVKAYAKTSHGIDPRHAWAVPLLVDSFIVVATGADLWFSTTNKQRRLWETWWPKALLAGAAGVSFVLNIAHAGQHGWAARGVAAIPPAALVLGVELLMLVLRRATALRVERLAAALAVPPTTAPPKQPPSVSLERNTAALPPRRRNSTPRAARNTTGGTPRADRQGGTPGAEQPATPQAEHPGRNAPDGTGQAEQPSRREQAAAWVRAERAAGRTPTGTQVAQRFGISTGLGRRAIRDADADPAAKPAHQPQPTTEALRLVGDRSAPDPAPALPAAQGR